MPSMVAHASRVRVLQVLDTLLGQCPVSARDRVCLDGLRAYAAQITGRELVLLTAADRAILGGVRAFVAQMSGDALERLDDFLPSD